MKILLLSICLSLLSLATFAQKVKIPGVETITLNNIGTIEDDGKVSGYYTFYTVDKVDKLNDFYCLKISDSNLKEIKTIEIVKEKNTTIVGAKFNGSAFMFVFFNAVKKTIEFVTYDKSLKVKGSFLNENLKNQEVKMYIAAYQGMFEIVYPIPNKGFMVYETKKNNKLGYEFTLFSNDLKSIWKIESPEDNFIHSAGVIFQDSEKIALLTMAKKSLIAQKFETEIVIFNANTGKEITNTPLISSNEAKFTLNMPHVIYNAPNKEFFLFGEYLKSKANRLKDPTLGFYTLKISEEGVIKNEKYSDYKKSLKALVHGFEKEKFNAKTNFLIHDYVLTAGGNLFVIGEIYYKTVDPYPVRSERVLNTNDPHYRGPKIAMKLVITDMVIFQFDKDLEMKKIDIFDKFDTDYPLASGYENVNLKLLSLMAQQSKSFDFEYVQIDEKSESFDIIYRDDERNQGEKVKSIVAAIRYNENKYVVNKINLDSKTDFDAILPATKGSVYIGGYYRKLKSYESSIETFK